MFRTRIWTKCSLISKSRPFSCFHLSHLFVEQVELETWETGRMAFSPIITFFPLFFFLFYWLYCYSCHKFPPFASPPPSTPNPSGSHPLLCSCPWVMHESSLATLSLILFLKGYFSPLVLVSRLHLSLLPSVSASCSSSNFIKLSECRKPSLPTAPLSSSAL